MKGINNQTAVKQAFSDMKPEILKKRECENSPYDYDNWVAGQSHVYTKESRYLNKKL